MTLQQLIIQPTNVMLWCIKPTWLLNMVVTDTFLSQASLDTWNIQLALDLKQTCFSVELLSKTQQNTKDMLHRFSFWLKNNVQLACIKHITSIHSEPGSNSFILSIIFNTEVVLSQQITTKTSADMTYQHETETAEALQWKAWTLCHLHLHHQQIR